MTGALPRGKYRFYYFPKSVAEKEIDLIERTQEIGFDKIIKFLDVSEPDRKIQYYFYPDEETKKYLMGDDWFAQTIYKDFIVHVLYTEKDKPIGEHEDAHLFVIYTLGFFNCFVSRGIS